MWLSASGQGPSCRITLDKEPRKLSLLRVQQRTTTRTGTLPRALGVRATAGKLRSARAGMCACMLTLWFPPQNVNRTRPSLTQLLAFDNSPRSRFYTKEKACEFSNCTML
eukprot:359985-Chlamydomonas_euryale.AAC.5